MPINGRVNINNPTTFVALSNDKGLINWLDSKKGKEAMEEFNRCFGNHGSKVKVVTPQGNSYEMDTREF